MSGVKRVAGGDLRGYTIVILLRVDARLSARRFSTAIRCQRARAQFLAEGSGGNNRKCPSVRDKSASSCPPSLSQAILTFCSLPSTIKDILRIIE